MVEAMDALIAYRTNPSTSAFWRPASVPLIAALSSPHGDPWADPCEHEPPERVTAVVRMVARLGRGS
jgi:hypothetical protein